VLDEVPDAPWKGPIFWGWAASGIPIQSIGTFYSHLCTSGRTDRDAVWVIGSDGPRESCVRWGSTGAKGRCHGASDSGFLLGLIVALQIGFVFVFVFFWLSMGYNFRCMIASDTLFDSRGGFSGSSYPTET